MKKCIGKTVLRGAGACAILIMLTLPVAGYEAGIPGATRDYGKSLAQGDPVSAANGAYYFELPLLSLGGPMRLECRLYYRSDLYRGYGLMSLPYTFWCSPYAHASSGMNLGTNVYATVYLPDARMVSFQRESTSNWGLTGMSADIGGHVYQDNVPRVRYQLQETTNGLYLADPSTARLYMFEKHQGAGGANEWRIRYIVDRNTNSLSFSYASPSIGRPASVSDGLGRTLSWSYASYMTNVADSAGRSASFYYETFAPDNGNDPVATLRSITNAGGQGMRFGYGGVMGGFYHLISAVRNPAGNTPYVQAYEMKTLYGESFPRVVSQWDAYSNQTALTYITNGNLVIVSAPDGGTNVYAHSSSHGFPALLTDPDGESILFAQDTNGHLASVSDRLGGTATFAYDPASGLPSAATNARGDALRFAWTPRAQSFVNPGAADTVAVTFVDLARIDYPDGSFETFDCDGRGNVTSRIDRLGGTWRGAYNSRGQLLAITNPAGGWSAFTYNPDGALATTRDSDTGITTYGYDASKRLTRVTHPDAAFAAWGYDSMDRLTAYTNELGQVARTAYDANGNAVVLTDPSGRATKFGYDAMNRLVAVTNRNGAVSRCEYNARGLPELIMDTSGVRTELGYDKHGRPTTMTIAGSAWTEAYSAEGLPQASESPTGSESGVGRDALGRVASFTNGLGQAVSFERDAMQRIAQTTDALGRTRRRRYDALGRLLSVEAPGLGLATNAYDALGRLVEMTDFNTQRWGFAYSPAGRLTSMSDPLTNTWSYSYDARGRMIGVQYPDLGTLALGFDAVGLVTNRQYAGGPSLAYAYDDNGRLTAADGAAMQYDAEGRVTNFVQNGMAFGYAWDAAGRLASVSYAGGSFTVNYQYDSANGLLTNVADTLSGASIGLEYDADFRLTAIRRPNGLNTTYAWDNAGRLTQLREGSLIDLQYDCNAAGEPTQRVTVAPLTPSACMLTSVSTQRYDAASQLAGGGYAYDARGRLTNAPGYSIEWDGAGRLTRCGAANLICNGLDHLVARAEAGRTNAFFHSVGMPGAPLLAERNETGAAWTAFYVWTPGGGLLYRIDPAAGHAVRHYHFDRNGNTLALSDATGAVTDAYAYSPYGRLLGRTGGSDQPFLFMGAYGVRREGTQQVYHAGARYYDAQSGRFFSREPLWPRIGAPMSANPYQYAGSDPAGLVDPSGLLETLAYGLAELVTPGWARAYEQYGMLGLVVQMQADLGAEAALEIFSREDALESLEYTMSYLSRYSRLRKQRAAGTGPTWFEEAMQHDWGPAPGAVATPLLPPAPPEPVLQAGTPAPLNPAFVEFMIFEFVGDYEAYAKAAPLAANQDLHLQAPVGSLADMFGLLIQTRTYWDEDDAHWMLNEALKETGGHVTEARHLMDDLLGGMRDRRWGNR
ncbi:MAG TPA: hypothetical protein DCZ95_11610 [Verrucomicrobia bacterium]|nr:MAG: hypothetical protein A2X46_01815 [Lentisphaerae bacterium GWF2_57_35]HBA84731.1 hypothetical protein [Verrucomicrobiota bacterium]